MKKRFFYEHPILGGLIAMAILAIVINLVSAVGALIAGVADGVMNNFEASANAEEAKSMGLYIGAIVASLLCVPVFKKLNKKSGYCGPYKIMGKDLKDVWLCIAIFAVVYVGLNIVSLLTVPGGFPKIPAPTFATVLMALYAGVSEEVMARCFPVALMMRNKPDSRRIWATALITASIFGVLHMQNLFVGQDLLYTSVQTLNAFGLGLFFAAIYLRTGSIGITIVYHALYDLVVFIVQSVVTGSWDMNPLEWAMFLLMTLLPLVFAFLMLRKKHHQAILDTWARTWPKDEELIAQ